MMLRSSSTPLLSSLLSSSASGSSNFHESPNHQPRALDEHPNHITFPSPGNRHRLHLPCSGGLRRVHSDGNLDSLGAITDIPNPPKRSAAPVLERIPAAFADSEGEEDEEEELLDRSVAIHDGIDGEAALFLARGLGIDGPRGELGFLTCGGDGGRGEHGGYSGGGGGGSYPVITGYGGERSDLETFLKKLVEEHPSSALFLRNYAQFLYKTKKDAQKAEEYYSRAILVAPGDGEILSEYAQLILEHHGDRERAQQYFDQAVQASPDDCQVLASYAHFLWEMDDEDIEEDVEDNVFEPYNGPKLQHGSMASASA